MGNRAASETWPQGYAHGVRRTYENPLTLDGLFALGAAGLTACTDETTTQPSRAAEPSPTVPDLAVATNTWIVRATMPQYRTGVAARQLTEQGVRFIASQ